MFLFSKISAFESFLISKRKHKTETKRGDKKLIGKQKKSSPGFFDSIATRTIGENYIKKDKDSVLSVGWVMKIFAYPKDHVGEGRAKLGA